MFFYENLHGQGHLVPGLDDGVSVQDDLVESVLLEGDLIPTLEALEPLRPRTRVDDELTLTFIIELTQESCAWKSRIDVCTIDLSFVVFL